MKSTVVISSARSLREGGYGDRYDALLPREIRDHLFAVGAPTWVPFEVALAHYTACDNLGLSVDEVLANGARVAPVHASGVGVILRLARAGGATPWTVLDRAPQYWERMYDGGELTVSHDGPKDARLIVRGQPLGQVAYWRIGFRGILQALATALSAQVYVRDEVERDEAGGPPRVTYSLSWA